MKILNFKNLAISVVMLVSTTSCDSFLNRPVEDSYTIDGFYQTDAQCFEAVNPVYNSPWYDFERGFVRIGDELSGNYYYGTTDSYQIFVLTSDDVNLTNASASLWSVNAYCNGIVQNIDMKAGKDVSLAAKNTVKGEAMTWKAMTYFYLVRIWGAVPIIDNNSAIIAAKAQNSLRRNNIADVYTYIIKTLWRAASMLPAKNLPGRIDKYSAYGLLSKVYLAKSGYGSTDGTRNQSELDSAAYYAGKVINESGRTLMPVYSDIFREKYNGTKTFVGEDLISLHCTVGTHWTCQNTEQSDLALNGFDEFADTWGTWTSPTIDLQNAFGEDAKQRTKDGRNYTDARRQATMMMMGDHYDYFWVDRGGFTYDWNSKPVTWPNGVVSTLTYGSATGANCVKFIVGDNNDNLIGSGQAMLNMQTSLSMHILRLADIYLIYAEAKLGNGATCTDPIAVAALNAVRARSISNYTNVTSFTFNDIFKERRLELAGEGDNWYDYVRLSYYNPIDAETRLANQERGYYNNLDSYYKGNLADASTVTVSSLKIPIANIANYYDKNLKSFVIPFPNTDVAMNPNLTNLPPVPFDFTSIGY